MAVKNSKNGFNIRLEASSNAGIRHSEEMKKRIRLTAFENIATVTRDQILEIKRRLTIGECVREIAANMGVNRSTIGHIRRNETFIDIGELCVAPALRGSRVRTTKLTDDQVIAIADRLKSGSSIAALAREYGLTPRPIFAIKHGISWSHLTGIKRIIPNKKRAKLSEDQVLGIGRLLECGAEPNRIAADTGVSASNVLSINRGARWRNFFPDRSFPLNGKHKNKLSPADRSEIIRRISGGEKQRHLAGVFSVSTALVSLMWKNHASKHVRRQF